MNTTYIYIEDSGNLHNTNTLVIVFIIFKNMHREPHSNKESFTTKKSFFKHIESQKFKIQYYTAHNTAKNIDFNDHVVQSILDNKDIFKI